MVDAPKDGGAAFPIAMRNDCAFTFQEGMSLRDYLAAHAPTPPADFKPRQKQTTVSAHGQTRVVWIDEPAIDREVRWRWEYADAMLKARAQ